MVKTLVKIKKFKSIGSKHFQARRIERRKSSKIKAKKKLKKNQNKNISHSNNNIAVPTTIPPQEDKLSRYSKSQNIFLFSLKDNVIQEYFYKEKEEFIPYPYVNNDGMKRKRNCIIYGLHYLLNNITSCFGFKFPENFKYSAMKLYDYFLDKSQKEMEFEYMGRIMYACIDIIDKEEKIRVFLNEDFQKNFTPDDEIDVLEKTEFKIYPIKPFDFYSLFCFTSEFIKRNDLQFLNYLTKFKEKFDDIAFKFLINEETKKNMPSKNYFSIFSLTYEATKNDLPLGDTFINEYMNNFKNIIQYSNEDYLMAVNQLKESTQLIEEARLNYQKILEENNKI